MKRLLKYTADSQTVVEERMWGKTLTLIFKEDRCARCGVCVEICPFQALTLTTIGIVRIDENKCVFCGLCSVSCIFKAWEMKEDGADSTKPVEVGVYPNFATDHRVNDKCLPCLLCKEVCPREAIDLKIEVKKKDELKTFEEGKKGEIRIDKEKCNFCGVCELFCDAFNLVDKDVSPYDINPFSDLTVDLEKCDYCKLCEQACPEEAIKVESNEETEATVPKIKGEIKIREDDCIKCGYCVDICPYDAMEIAKIFEGHIKNNERKCRRGSYTAAKDCKSCIEVCPTKTIYFPKPKGMFTKGKNVDLVDKYCIYCGACVQLCPDDVFIVERDKINCATVKSPLWDKVSEKLSSVRRLTELTET